MKKAPSPCVRSVKHLQGEMLRYAVQHTVIVSPADKQNDEISPENPSISGLSTGEHLPAPSRPGAALLRILAFPMLSHSVHIAGPSRINEAGFP